MKYYMDVISVEVKLSMCISWRINIPPQATFVPRLPSNRQAHGGLFCQAQQGFFTVLLKEALFGSVDGQVRTIR